MARKKRYIIVILLCLFFYPAIPLIANILVIWRMNNKDSIAFSRTRLFASIARNISGCFESPIQMIITLWLIGKNVLDVPWSQASLGAEVITDQYGNAVPVPQIPIISMGFSILSIMVSVIQINILNVYVENLNSWDSVKKAVNLSAGHFPFFLSTCLFRMFSMAFVLLFLNYHSIVPFAFIFFGNIFIGYGTYGSYKVPRKKIQRALSLKRKQTDENHPVLKKKYTMGKKEADTTDGRNEDSAKRQKKKQQINTPVWLNAFLSMFVPCCYVHSVDGAILEVMEQKYRNQVKEAEKAFQKRVIQYLSLIHI